MKDDNIEIPKDVEIEVKDMEVLVKGPKGEIKRDFSNPMFNSLIKFEKNDKFEVKTESKSKKINAVVGTIHAHINNMITGVTKGFLYKMKIHYTHFPMTVSVKGDMVEIKNFMGEKGVRTIKIIGDTKISVQKDELVIEGINIEDVSQTAARIEQICRISGKDRRVFLDGIYITEKKAEVGKK